ncbi:cytospin-A isoform X1 [Coregonus clupeaformis]|uniref:cytospin-A isoform X1 n=1 Tax=Coregonus clupeaformis TaxID=59861 RepID=UPI001BDFC0EA|nr:cytospin-A isoform X1 [Coregonus clupeaformis]XP_041716016.1 cytospin-A isoform X1 [Coregonus clupeaformis]
MGNVGGKDGHGPTGSHLDLFQTPPSSPSDSDLAPAVSQLLQQGTLSSGATRGIVCQGGASPISNWSHTLSVPPEWAVISVESSASPPGTGIEMEGSRRTVQRSSSHKSHNSSPVSPGQGPQFEGSSLEHSWQERDSGMEPHAAPERAGEEMALALFSLLEHHRSAVGLSPGLDAPAGAAELLSRLLVERKELVEEVRNLKDTLRTERAEWHQFQCDLQVAVSVADRLRVEAEETMGMLRESHGNVEGQLDQVQCRQQDTDREMESLRTEHREACHRLSALTLEHQQTRAELDTLRLSALTLEHQQTRAELDTLRLSALTLEHQQTRAELDTLRHTLGERERDSLREREKDSHREMEGRDTEERTFGEDTSEDISTMEALDGKKIKDSEREVEGEKRVKSEGEDVNMGGQSPEELVRGGENLLKVKGVAEAYLRNLAAGEKGCNLRDPQRIVMMSERSRSLSRLPLPTDTLPAQNGSSQTTTSTTLPLCKKEEPAKGRRMDRILQRQDSWSSFYTKKQEEDQNADPLSSFRPQDGFSMLLRSHGGSRRNSLLRWCQSRTQGYKNIEITNFSSSWEDGLAFCAVYHTYLPTHIPYSSLSTGDKSENLDLAFQTGESVGITATLTVEEMLRSGGPDWQRVLGYVESMFRHFEM